VDWLWEDPTWVLLGGAVVAGFLGLIWTQTRNNLVGSAAVAILFALGILAGLASWVETDREMVQSQLRKLAEAIEHNDKAQVLTLISPQSSKLRSIAEQSFNLYVVESAKITDLKIEVPADRTPPQAEARFVGGFRGTVKGLPGGDFAVPVLRRFTLFYRQESATGPWLLHDFRSDPFPAQGDGPPEKLPFDP